MKQLIPVLLGLLLFAGCLKDEPFKQAFGGFEPQDQADDWELSTPQNENVDAALLEQAYRLVYADDRFTMARSLLVFRNGKLIAEAYPNDPGDLNRIANIQSCTKSVTSILAGIAVQQGLINSLDEKLYDIFPEDFDPDVSKRDITLKDALTMRTGLEFDNSGAHTLTLYKTEENSTAYILSQKKLYDPGTVMNYNDGAPHLISKAIETKTGKSLRDYAKENLFTPLNITDWTWEAAKDGTTFGAFSLYLKPRDFGKIGQLLLQQGVWNGKTLIDSSYLSEATTTQVSANFNGEPYGYYFWTIPASNGYSALGHGGQFLLVVPDKNLVAVYTAWPYTSGNFFDQHNRLFDLIIHSCQ